MAALAHAGGIEFDSPAENDHGSMMLGNGMLGANAWVSADGVLHARFQRQDSWNEVGEHVKVGEIEYVTGRAVLMNVELPELCGVFPFRLSTFATADREMAIDTFETRTQRRYSGWNQDELIAAYLGLTEDARSHLVDRVMNNSNAEFRWPAFWGPNYDWMPDQCAGGNIQNIIQSMLVQYDGRVIHLLPAWPKEWNAEFKVHAPYRTVLEGRVENGKIVRLEVTPSERRKDVVVD